MEEKLVEITLLYDFYSKILTQKQRQVIEYYYMKDYSLAEIGMLLNISRQAVHDNLKRAQKQLFTMEGNLGLVEEFHRERKEWPGIISRIDNVIKILENELDELNLAKELQDIKRLVLLNTIFFPMD